MSSNPTDVVFRRCAAYVIDGIVAAIVAAAVLSLIDPGWHRTSGGEVTISPIDNFTLSGTLLLFQAVQVMVLEGLYGWTVGKLIMQLRVVRPMGQPPGPLRALVRYACLLFIDGFPYCAPLLGFGLMVGTTSHRRVGDLLADTYVIDAVYAGRAILATGDGVQASAVSLRPEDLGVSREELEQALAARPKKPVYDKDLDTYVVWSKKHDRMMRFDKASESWVPL